MGVRALFKLIGLIGMEGVETTTKELKKVEKEAKKTQRKMNQLGRDAKKAGKSMSLAFTVPLIAIGGAVLKFGADFDKSMSSSLAIVDDLTDALRKDMRKAAIDVSKTTRSSAKEAADAYFFLASAGLNAVQQIEALPKAAKFAQAGNFDLALATDLLTDSQSALGLASKDNAEHMMNLSRVSDVLVKGNTLANTSVQQLAESLTNKAGAALRSLGKDIEEGAAVLLAFGDQGVKGVEAGTALNIVMRDLQRSALGNSEAFERANVSVFDSSGEMRNMADIVGDLENLLVGMSDKQKRATLTMLGFQDKSIAFTNTLLGTSDAIRDYEAALNDAGGTTDRVAEEQMKNFWDQLGLIKDRLIAVGLLFWDTLGGPIMNIVLPAIDALTSAFEGLAGWFNDLSDGMKDTIMQWVLLAASIGPVLIIVGKLVVIGGSIQKMYKLWIAGQTALNIAMTANPIGLIIVGIGLLIAAGILLVNNWEMVKEKMISAWDSVSHFVMLGVSHMKQFFFKFIANSIAVIALLTSVIPVLGEKVAAVKAKLDAMAAQEEVSRIQRRKTRAETIKAADAEAAYAETISSAEEAAKSSNETGKETIATKKAISIATDEEIKAEETLAAKRKSLAEEWHQKLLKQSVDKRDLSKLEIDEALKVLEENSKKKFELLSIETDDAVLKAEELGASTLEIEEFYKNERLTLAEEEAQIKLDLLEKESAKREEIAKKSIQLGISSINKLGKIANKFTSNDLKRIDKRKQSDIDRIKASTLSEEEKALKIAEIEQKADAESLKLKREQAKRDQKFALFNIVVNTAQAIIKAFSDLGPIAGGIAAGVIGAIGIAEGVAVASEPIPFADGGFIKKRAGGINAIIGEGDEDEIVFPVETGIDLFFEKFMGRVKSLQIPSFGDDSEAGELGVAGAPVNFNIGTLVADESGIKQLERRMRPFRIAEDQREGAI